jgi:sortase A
MLVATIERGLQTIGDLVAEGRRAGALDDEDRAMLVSLVLAVDELLDRLDRALRDRPGHPSGGVQAELHRRFDAIRGEVATATALGLDLEPVGEVPAPPAPSVAEEAPSSRWGLRIGTAITVLGALLVGFVVFQFWLTDLSEQRSQRELASEFQQRLVVATALAAAGPVDPDAPEFGEVRDLGAEADAASDAEPGAGGDEDGGGAEGEEVVVAEELPRGTPVALLAIPAIGLDKIVVEGTGANDLKQGPGHYRHSPLPGRPGNAVIACHRTTYGEPCRRLGELEKGDDIDVTTTDGIFTYHVVDTEMIEPGDPDVIGPSDDNRLTLVTANPEYQASERLVVVAELEGEPVEVEGAPDPEQLASTPLTPDESGLTRDVTAWAPILLWGELLVAAIVAAGLLYRRWRRWPTWLLTTPVILAFAFLWYESLNRLLPSTL